MYIIDDVIDDFFDSLCLHTKRFCCHFVHLETATSFESRLFESYMMLRLMNFDGFFVLFP